MSTCLLFRRNWCAPRWTSLDWGGTRCREKSADPLASKLWEGGLWLPRPGSEREARLFRVFHPSGPHPASLIVQASEGDVMFTHYGKEKDFIASIKVMDK